MTDDDADDAAGTDEIASEAKDAKLEDPSSCSGAPNKRCCNGSRSRGAEGVAKAAVPVRNLPAGAALVDVRCSRIDWVAPAVRDDGVS
jgi:hypothetical protein